MAEETKGNETTAAPGAGAQTGGAAQTETPGKTFTQEELNAIIGARLAEVKKTQLPESDLKAFRDWQKSRKTEAEQAAEREAEFTRTASENAQLKAEKKVLSAQAKPEFSEFVAAQVLGMGDEFDKNLIAYKKDHPQYFGETVVKKVSSSHSMSGDGGRNTTNQIMNDLIRGL